MSETNIFLNPYEQPENKLTYCFLSLLEHLDPKISLQIMQHAGVRETSADEIKINLLYGGGEGNPDGRIAIVNGLQHTVVLFENKTLRRQLDLEQIRAHLRSHPYLQYLLVITSDKNDQQRLITLADPRILFSTWEGILKFLERISHNIENQRDGFLLKQFVEYLELSDEVRRARMIPRDLIEAQSQCLALFDKQKKFFDECWLLMEAISSGVIAPFKSEIQSSSVKKAYGRLGVECGHNLQLYQR
jgi:hypothetical protein